MNEDAEKHIAVPQEGSASEAIQHEGKFTNAAKQNTWAEATADNRKSRKDTATQEGLTDEKIAEIKAKGGFAKFELFDSTVGITDGTLIATKDTKDGRKDAHDVREKPKQKPVPAEGQEISLDDFLNKYKTPIMDAYERSKGLKDGEPGKSKTLEELVERLKNSPWKSDYKFKFDSTAHNPDYDNFHSRITINPNKSPAEQIEQFAHETFHASHQNLQKLWGGSKELSVEDYVKVKLDLEIASYMSEIKVHNEITLAMGAGPVTYAWNDKNGRAQPEMDLGELYATKGLQGLTKFIADEAYTDMKINGTWVSSNYRNYYAQTYSAYKSGWLTAHTALEKNKEDPAYKKKVLEDHY